MVAVLGARSAPEPRGDLVINVLRAGCRALTAQPLPQHALPHLVELQGGAKPIGDLRPGHRRIILSAVVRPSSARASGTHALYERWGWRKMGIVPGKPGAYYSEYARFVLPLPLTTAGR